MKNILLLSAFLLLLPSCTNGNGGLSFFGWAGIALVVVIIIAAIQGNSPKAKAEMVKLNQSCDNFKAKYETATTEATVVKPLFDYLSIGGKEDWKFIAFYDDKSIISFVNGDLSVDIPYDQIRGIEVKVDNNIAYEKSGIGRAVVGGLLAGGAGAVVGAVTGKSKRKEIINNVEIVVKTNDIKNPTISFSCFNIADYTLKSKDFKQQRGEIGLRAATFVADIVAIILDRDKK